jgi:hypothetical protein
VYALTWRHLDLSGWCALGPAYMQKMWIVSHTYVGVSSTIRDGAQHGRTWQLGSYVPLCLLNVHGQASCMYVASQV